MVKGILMPMSEGVKWAKEFGKAFGAACMREMERERNERAEREVEMLLRGGEDDTAGSILYARRADVDACRFGSGAEGDKRIGVGGRDVGRRTV